MSDEQTSIPSLLDLRDRLSNIHGSINELFLRASDDPQSGGHLLGYILQDSEQALVDLICIMGQTD